MDDTRLPRAISRSPRSTSAGYRAWASTLVSEIAARTAAPISCTRCGEEASERDLRKFVGEHVADFKTPRQIVILDEIPKGASGKIQRIGLAEKLGLTS